MALVLPSAEAYATACAWRLGQFCDEASNLGSTKTFKSVPVVRDQPPPRIAHSPRMPARRGYLHPERPPPMRNLLVMAILLNLSAALSKPPAATPAPPSATHSNT